GAPRRGGQRQRLPRVPPRGALRPDRARRHPGQLLPLLLRPSPGAPPYRAPPPRMGPAPTHNTSCRYCYGMHRSLLRIAGHSEADVDRIVRDSMLVDLSPAERIAVDYARRLSRCAPRPDRTDFEKLVAAG